MKEKRLDSMPTKVGLDNYEVIACHGAYEFEKTEAQPFIFSISATLENDEINDDLNRTLNYADLQNAITKVVAGSDPVNLMETLCSNIIDELKSNDLIAKIEIRVEKPDAPLPMPGGLAFVELIWTRV